MMISSEKPREPSGIFVVISPIALRLRKSAISSCSAPAYSPRSGSMQRKPPPATMPASIESPTPFGGLNAKPRSTGPRLPSWKASVPTTPRRSTEALSGPSAPLPVTLSSSGSPPGEAPSPTWTYSIRKPAIDRWTGRSTPASAEPSKLNPSEPDHRKPRSKCASAPPPGTREVRNESPPFPLHHSMTAGEPRHEVRRDAAPGDVNAAADRYRVGLHEPTARTRQQRELLAALGREAQQSQHAPRRPVDHTVRTEQPDLDRDRLPRAELHRDPGVERERRLELHRHLLGQREAQIRGAVHIRRHAEPSVSPALRSRPERVQRDADVQPARLVPAEEARDQLGGRLRVRLRHRNAGQLLLDAARQLPHPHRRAHQLDERAEVGYERVAVEVRGAPPVPRLHQAERIREQLSRADPSGSQGGRAPPGRCSGRRRAPQRSRRRRTAGGRGRTAPTPPSSTTIRRLLRRGSSSLLICVLST